MQETRWPAGRWSQARVQQQGRGGKEAGVAVTGGGVPTCATSSGWTKYREDRQEGRRCGAAPAVTTRGEFRW